MRGILEVSSENDYLRTQLACVCDKLNTWARESNVEECKNPYKNLELRNLVDRIWIRISSRKNE